MAKTVKVILEKGIKKLGSAGNVASVTPGYAFNYLIPNNFASLATKAAEEEFEKKRKHIQEQDAKHLKSARDAELLISLQPILFASSASENGKLYGSISQLEIANYLNDHFKLGDYKINKSQVLMQGHIKEYGITQVKLELHPDVIISIKVSVANTIELAQKHIEKA